VLIIGGVALAGGAAALLTGGGPPKDGGGLKTVNVNEVLTLEQYERDIPINTGGSGTLTATLTWAEPDAHLNLYLLETATRQGVQGNDTGPTSLQLTAQVTAKQYTVVINHRRESRVSATFSLVVRHP
jgi:hypothetical protein